MSFLNPNYKTRNLLALNFAGFSCIALVVFLAATQPFYLSDVTGINPEKIGTAVGTLGAIDELVAIVVAPLLGTLIDRINGYAWTHQKIPSGSRVLELCGFLILGLSLAGYGKWAHNLFPDLWFWRGVFAIGVSAVMSIVTVMLHEVNNSSFTWAQMAIWRKLEVHTEAGEILLAESEIAADADADADDRSPAPELAAEPNLPPKKHGSLAALLGVSTGLGAVFSVLFFLTLPVRLGDHHENWSSEDSLRASYTLLSVVAAISGAVVFTFAYDCVRQRRLLGHSPDHELPDASYLKLLQQGYAASKTNKRLQLAYVAAFVSRSTTVATALFIPLLVYKFYYNSDKCGTSSLGETPDKSNCYEGYVFLAILTGVAQTVALVSSPFWGILVDSKRVGSGATLGIASVSGMLGTFGLCIVGRGAESYDPRNALCFVLVSCIGLSQIGMIIASMSIISSVGQTVEKTEHRVIGSILGLYSLCGGLGILVITIVGGKWSDKWVLGPFFLLGLFNAALAVVTVRSR